MQNSWRIVQINFPLNSIPQAPKNFAKEEIKKEDEREIVKDLMKKMPT